MTPEQYLTDNNLWELDALKVHAQEKSVYVIESQKYHGLAMLHYMDECQYDNLWSPLSRMSRGLILDIVNKKVIAHPFDKFFNLGQMPETKYDALQTLGGGFQTSEKLDGSMIICFRHEGMLRFTTKGSFDSEHGEYAASLPLLKEYDYLAFERYAKQGTLMFELVTKRYQIVIDYNKKNYEEGLYLIGYRDNETGLLATSDTLDHMAQVMRVPRAKTYTFDSLDHLIDTAKTLPVLEEGFVLRFPGELLVKVKGDAYLVMHRFISHLSDRNILLAVADGTADELVNLCPDEFRDEVLKKIQGFKKRGEEFSKMCYTYYEKAPKGLRKEFAEWVNGNVEKYYRGFLFQLLDGKVLDYKRVCKVIEEVDGIDGRTKI